MKKPSIREPKTDPEKHLSPTGIQNAHPRQDDKHNDNDTGQGEHDLQSDDDNLDDGSGTTERP